MRGRTLRHRRPVEVTLTRYLLVCDQVAAEPWTHGLSPWFQTALAGWSAEHELTMKTLCCDTALVLP